MNAPVNAFAAFEKGSSLRPYTYDAGPLGAEQVEIAVTHCGICHSDLSMIDNEWGMSGFPLVPGHEVVGTVREAGPQVKGLVVGQWQERE